MVFLDLKDDRSERVRYDYTDYPIYIRRALLFIRIMLPPCIGTMILNLLLSCQV